MTNKYLKWNSFYSFDEGFKFLIRSQITLSKGVTRNWEVRIFHLPKLSFTFTGNCWFLARSKCESVLFLIVISHCFPFAFEVYAIIMSHCFIFCPKNLLHHKSPFPFFFVLFKLACTACIIFCIIMFPYSDRIWCIRIIVLVVRLFFPRIDYVFSV